MPLDESEPPAAGLTLQPMVHVEAMGPALTFYQALGAEVVHGAADGDFALLRLAGSEVSLLAHPPNPEQDEGTVELNFACTGDLHALEADLVRAGVTVVQTTTDQGFGQQLQLASPDGLLVKINRLQPDRYT